MTVQPTLHTLVDRPFDLLLAMDVRLRAGGENLVGDVVRNTWTGLTFVLQGDHYAAPQNDVSEVLEMPKLTWVPRAKPWLLGIANVRGDLLPVIDLGCLMGNPQAHITDNSRVVVLNDHEVPAGFLVDSVGGFRNFTADEQRHELLPEAANAPADDVTLDFLLGAFVREGLVWRVFSLQKLANAAIFRDAGI